MTELAWAAGFFDGEGPYHRVQIEGRGRVAEVLTKMWPFLTSPKKEQAHRVWDEALALRRPKSPPMPPLPQEQ